MNLYRDDPPRAVTFGRQPVSPGALHAEETIIVDVMSGQICYIQRKQLNKKQTGVSELAMQTIPKYLVLRK